MVYGAIDVGNAPWYTNLTEVFQNIGHELESYNWLITDSEVNSRNGVCEHLNTHNYVFLSNEELTALLLKDQAQWMFGVLSGFCKDIPLQKILEYPLPRSDHADFWSVPLSLQHPFAEIEIVPWDSMCVLVISKDKKTVDRFREAYPNSQDLEQYNRSDTCRCL